MTVDLKISRAANGLHRTRVAGDDDGWTGAVETRSVGRCRNSSQVPVGWGGPVGAYGSIPIDCARRGWNIDVLEPGVRRDRTRSRSVDHRDIDRTGGLAGNGDGQLRIRHNRQVRCTDVSELDGSGPDEVLPEQCHLVAPGRETGGWAKSRHDRWLPPSSRLGRCARSDEKAKAQQAQHAGDPGDGRS